MLQLREENLALERKVANVSTEMSHEHEAIEEQLLVHYEESVQRINKKCVEGYTIRLDELRRFKDAVEKQMFLEKKRMAEKSKGLEQLYNQYQRTIQHLEYISSVPAGSHAFR